MKQDVKSPETLHRLFGDQIVIEQWSSKDIVIRTRSMRTHLNAPMATTLAKKILEIVS